MHVVTLTVYMSKCSMFWLQMDSINLTKTAHNGKNNLSSMFMVLLLTVQPLRRGSVEISCGVNFSRTRLAFTTPRAIPVWLDFVLFEPICVVEMASIWPRYSPVTAPLDHQCFNESQRSGKAESRRSRYGKKSQKNIGRCIYYSCSERLRRSLRRLLPEREGGSNFTTTLQGAARLKNENTQK